MTFSDTFLQMLKYNYLLIIAKIAFSNGILWLLLIRSINEIFLLQCVLFFSKGSKTLYFQRTKIDQKEAATGVVL